VGGAVGSGTPQTIPDSLYLTPKHFGSNPWLWVNPSNRTVTTLLAKACLEQGKMPTCMQVVQAIPPRPDRISARLTRPTAQIGLSLNACTSGVDIYAEGSCGGISTNSVT
jgi:hypothetical protein